MFKPCSQPGSSLHGIYQAKILEWVAISSSRRSSWPRDPVLQADSLPTELLGTDQRSGPKTVKRSLWLKNHWKRGKEPGSGTSTKSGHQWGNTIRFHLRRTPAFLLVELWRSLSLENCENLWLNFPQVYEPHCDMEYLICWNISIY